MKELQILLNINVVLPLYPTWFRWKANNANNANNADKLFISHMVQMKDDQKRPSISIYLRSLYPTWFRWKVHHSELLL